MHIGLNSYATYRVIQDGDIATKIFIIILLLGTIYYINKDKIKDIFKR